ncbi:LysE family translocator [Nitratireductor basaltis]|uniref:Lysine exporter protein LysE/YggA n=1 Tax=Nitratireductor basaltis TaxID=472175 RepID=A0A084UB37_9HYPH|nr:LysE family translocator [Nitratireductor basaltis]KFB10173.1 Lysine exporter protein LysE/YggA [Nitratireductor basaltis]
MIEPGILISYTIACALLVMVPGPSVTVIVANSLRHGAGAGLQNVFGTQLGLASMIAVLAAGLSAVIASMGWLFEILRLVGAAYLIWLGYKMWRSDGQLAEDARSPARNSFILQGFIVIWSNPKALLFFGAFIPQFVDPVHSPGAQTVILGSVFMAVATVGDSLYAFAAAGAGRFLTRTRIRIVERVSGSFLICGGLWLALTRRA